MKRSWLIGVLLFVGALFGSRLNGAEDENKNDLARLQGKWQVVGKDATGAEVRVVKTIDGNRELLEQFRNGELIHAHAVDFKLRRTDEVHVFTYSNMVVTVGPRKGLKGPDKGSYIYQVRGDQWLTIEGFMIGDPEEGLPDITLFTRVKGAKKMASAR